jgi:TonB family protein
MGLNRNIMLSLVIHASLMLAAMTYAVGKSAYSDLRGKYVAVTLVENSVVTKTAEPPDRKKKAAVGVVAPRSAQGSRKPSRVPAAVSPQEEAAASALPDDTDSAALLKPTAEIFGSVNVKTVPERNNVGSSAGAVSVSLLDQPGNRGMSAQEKSRSGERDASVTEIIRGAIQRALIYPAAARRRGIEGKVVAEFRINEDGLPEEVRVTRSSGHGLLDKAAKETILRAAPLPVVKGRIKIPITFRLMKADY